MKDLLPFAVITVLLCAVLIVVEILLKELKTKGRAEKDSGKKYLKKNMQIFFSADRKKGTGKISEFMQKIEFGLISKSGIRRFIPFFDVRVLLLLSGVVFVFVFGPVYKRVEFIPVASLVSFIAAILPFMALDFMGRINSEKIRKQMCDFIAVLNRWYHVREDIIFAFAKTAESGIAEPLRTICGEFAIQVNAGMDPYLALNIMNQKVDNPQFYDFIINIRQNLKFRGNVIKLLCNLEEQFSKLNEEFERRKLSTYKDRILIYCVMFAVLFIGGFFLKFNQQAMEYYFTTSNGRLLLTLFCLLYTAGFLMASRITSFRY